MNVLQDQIGIYLLGVNDSSEWVLSRIGTDLSTTVLTTFAKTGTNDGYAFMINGTLFMGESYNSEFVTQSYSVAEDTLSAVDFQLDSSLVSIYRNNTFYDALEDALYIFNVGDYRLEKVDGAAALFGVDLAPGAQVPLPATAIPLLMGLLGIGALRRRA